MSLIFRELSLEFNKDIINELGIETGDENSKKVINVLAKDSFVIRKSISLDDLKTVLNNLISIEEKEDKFSLGYFVNAKKNGYSTKDINNLMIDYFMEGNIDNFILVGDNYLEYYMNGNRYLITDSDNNIIYESNEPIVFNELFKYCFSESISKNSIDKFLKYNITVYNDNDIVLYPIKIISCLQGYVEDSNKTPFFLFNDNWIMFDSKYEDNLDKDFSKIYLNLTDINSELSTILKNNDVRMNEDTYNKKFADLNIDHIEKWKKEINNKELATRTKNDLFKYLKSVLNYGTKWHDFNFASMYNKMTNFNDPNELPKEMEFYTYEEFKKFISVEEDIKWICLFKVLYYCGLRRGELRGLTWKNIDLEKKSLSVVQNVVNVSGDHGYWQITTPKTRTSTRTIPIPEKVCEDLIEYKKECKKYYGFNDKWFVFGDIAHYILMY